MTKTEFAQWIFENYTIGQDTMARELLDNVLNETDGMEPGEQYEYLCRMIPQVPEHMIHCVCY